jgi:hypothetical protein
MEVHAHTHTARKKWTHYFWEFLMLFFAVTLGFFVENQREHFIEHQREKQFIKSIIVDLSQDTIAINQLIADYEQKGKDLDSLMALLNAPDIKEKGATIYLKGRSAPRTEYFTPIDRTILQMKNSGGFRLIRNDSASTSILNYYASINFLELLKGINSQQAETYRNMTIDIFDPMVFERMISNQTKDRIIMPDGNPQLLTYDKKQLTRLTGAIHYFNSTRRALGIAYLKQKQAASNLISLLKKEYHLK